MDGQIDLFTLLTLVVALVAIFKLRSVLGRRTGDEESRIERRQREAEQAEKSREAGPSEKVVTLPRREREDRSVAQAAGSQVAEVESRIKSLGAGDTAITSGLLDILKLDAAFDPDHFLRGARQAYEMIVTAFAEGNRTVLRDLLSNAVQDSFFRAIGEREQRGEVIDQSFVGISKADIIEAETEKSAANITVRFVSQLISATRNRAGAVIDGDPGKVRDVTDIWTFSRDHSTAKGRRNPNWKLVATQSPN
jgi:predicted lipid-binding transport protein (Tim44 family)